ncbi:hypothetical protein [Massilibacterium senegalense]|uniref:hypothetical protein n=1 Tax=Massilibacterium senegalense TaxID=1632858 RepID=UPI00078425B2|nr:hypothetical protein [Massilibacterium senegalense]
MIQFTKKNIIISLLVSFVLIVATIVIYITLVSPNKKEAEKLLQEVQQEETQIAMLEQKIKDVEEQIKTSSTYIWQRQLPISPLADQFILMLEKAEVLSDTVILDMQLKNGEASVEGTGDAKEGEEQEEQIEVDTGEGTVPQLKSLEATLEISADNYYEIEKFMNTVQELERVSFVNKVNFKGKEEVLELKEEAEKEKLQAKLTVTTYYAPDLKSLKENGPAIEFPEPSNKTTPLYEKEKKQEN